MRFEIAKTDVVLPQTVHDAIDHKVAKLTERLKRYHPDVADLELRVEFNTYEKTHECALNLKAFKDTLHAKKAAPELRVAVDKTFDALLKELDHYRAKINKSL